MSGRRTHRLVWAALLLVSAGLATARDDLHTPTEHRPEASPESPDASEGHSEMDHSGMDHSGMDMIHP